MMIISKVNIRWSFKMVLSNLYRRKPWMNGSVNKSVPVFCPKFQFVWGLNWVGKLAIGFSATKEKYSLKIDNCHVQNLLKVYTGSSKCTCQYKIQLSCNKKFCFRKSASNWQRSAFTSTVSNIWHDPLLWISFTLLQPN